MYSNDRVQLRTVYREAWRKGQANEPLSPLETLMVHCIQEHPEYQRHFANDSSLDADFSVEAGDTNPFLHISLHMAIREQVHMDRPSGIQGIYHQLCQTTQDPHRAEHALMEHLAECIWRTNRGEAPLNDTQYIQTLKAQLTAEGLT